MESHETGLPSYPSWWGSWVGQRAQSAYKVLTFAKILIFPSKRVKVGHMFKIRVCKDQRIKACKEYRVSASGFLFTGTLPSWGSFLILL